MIQESIDSFAKDCIISNDPETIGFDLSSGTKWIYPENYPRRDYQFTIVQTALYSNTLVCLPTGLGKTFIAAVIMYNFWRWYPTGRVIFLAPTRPLVAQQIDACNKIMGIPIDETIELTGAINRNKRQHAWTQKRIIFATPQTFQKDLQNNYVPCELIKCIIFDEAHKALRKHSYCEIINLLNKKTKFFRVVALSATPGNKIDHVQEVIKNLHISKIELRDDNSIDIIPYINDRSIEKVIVCLSKELNDYKERYVNIMDCHVRILMKFKMLQGNLTNISKGKIFMLRKHYETKTKDKKNQGIIMKTLNILLTMYHGYELLLKHGLRAFYNFYSNHSEKFWLESELDLQILLKDIKNYIGNLPEIESLHNDNILNVPENIIFGHTKFYKLSDILKEHFNLFSQQGKSTRVIVFVEYRDIVNEIYVLLLQKRPLIRPQMFVGRAGQSEKQQITALEDFRNNKVNVLISTSVGEEGLDVGEVDLIVCFDISTSTPIRFVQRIGRTGRKRNGRVVVLLTAGKEEETFTQTLLKKNSLNEKIMQCKKITSSLYESSPRMVPININPQCLPIFFKTQSELPVVSNKKRKQQIQKKPRINKKDAIQQENPSVPLPSIHKKDCKIKNYENTQSTMVKFLTCQQKLPTSCNYNSDSGILSEEFEVINNKTNSIENLSTIIKPKDVKLLTTDNNILEFLTLCATKNSEPESSNLDLFKIDRTWIPISSPVSTFHDFDVPSSDVLSFINDLTPYDESFENESKPFSNQSITSFVSIDLKPGDIQKNHSFVESKYVALLESTNFKQSEQKGINESEINNDLSKTTLKCTEKINLEDLNIEITTSKMFNDSFTFNPKYNQTENSINTDSIKLKNTDFSKNNFPKESQEILSEVNANIEVDFQNILEEYTESEGSSSQPLICIDQFKEASNFNDLFKQASSEEDLFQFSPDKHDITITPNIHNIDNMTNSPKLSIKRSRSNSPCQELVKKIKRISDTDSSDSESTIIFGTPTKSNEIDLFSNENTSNLKSVSENDYPGSDQDLFDDPDFETQFSFTSKDEEIIKSKENNKLFRNEKDEIFSCKDKTKKLDNEIKNIGLSTIDEEYLNKNKILCESIIQKNVNTNNNLLLNEINLIGNNISLYGMKSQKEIEDNLLSEEEKSNSYADKNVSSMDVLNFNFDNLKDNLNFDFSINNINNEKKINRFLSITEFSSSSRNSVNFMKQINMQQSNIELALKNLSILSTLNKTFDFSENYNLKDFIIQSLIDEQSNLFMNVNYKNKIFNFRNVLHPHYIHLFSIKKGFKDSIIKEKNNIIIPQCKDNLDIKPIELIVTDESKINCSNKENEPKNLRDYDEEKEKIISPEIKNGNSKESMFNRKNIVRRKVNKFIDNEAMVSSDEETTEGSSGEDADLTNFISYTQDQSDTADMKAHYLQTLNKSPIRSGAFMFKPLKNLVSDFEIYSQPPSQVEDTYLHDSFCVANEENISINTSNESVLENIEFTLANRRNAIRRKQRLKFKDLINLKKQKNCKKNIHNQDASISSSEDETEALRKQVLEESKILKQIQT